MKEMGTETLQNQFTYNNTTNLAYEWVYAFLHFLLISVFRKLFAEPGLLVMSE